MTVRDRINRRELFVKLGLLFDGVIAVVLGVPIVRFLFSPLAGNSQGNYDSWLSLGPLQQYPAGQTRLATYRNPVVTPTDGETANVACWVRRIDNDRFQVFAINCAHLGCPVRWFPQSGLFMCPCHGGGLYADPAPPGRPPRVGVVDHECNDQASQHLVYVPPQP